MKSVRNRIWVAMGPLFGEHRVLMDESRMILFGPGCNGCGQQICNKSTKGCK